MRKYSSKVYSKEVLMKSAYAFTEVCFIHLDIESDNYLVTITPKDDQSEDELYLKFENELIAQETRRIVAEKTRNLRELIVARALSSTLINKEEAFDDNSGSYSANNILKDWFANNE